MLWIYVEADEDSEWVNHWDQLFSLKGIEVPSRGDKEKHEYSNWIEETMITLSNFQAFQTFNLASLFNMCCFDLSNFKKMYRFAITSKM